MQLRPVTRRLAVVASLAALAVPAMASVAGADVATRTRAQASDSASGEVLATLRVTSGNVSVRKEGKKKFKPATDGQALREGDTIKTDATGAAEVDYGNDAFTRLDVNTTFTIVVLTDEQGARQVQGSLETGQTWNRTASLTESGSFEQEGAGANATVRGTAFSILCDTVDHCTFTAVVDDIDLTGLDGVTRLLTPLTQCESSDTSEGGEVRDLTGVLCGDITQVPADQLPAWILQNLIKDLALGLPDGGILTGTIVVDDTGAVFFVPTPAPGSPPPSGGGSDPVPPAAPVLDDPPIAVDFVDSAIGALEFTPVESIEASEGDAVNFVVRVVPGFDGNLYVVFVQLPTAVGTVCTTPGGACNNAQVRGEAHPNARYLLETVFTFNANAFPGCEDISCASEIRSDDLEFFVENEDGTLVSESAVVAVNVEDAYVCGDDVTADC